MKILSIISFIVTLSLSTSLWATLDEDLALLTRKVQESQQCLAGHDLNDIEVVKKDLAFMVSIDQEVRRVFMQNTHDEKVRDLMHQTDCLYTAHMKAILQHYRWITISKFGTDADRQAWLLVQHADHDPDFQRSCLKVLEELFPDGETNKENYAYLYDRVALKEGKRQRYGTQVLIHENRLELFPAEENVELYRQELGLVSLESYLSELRKICFPEKRN